MGQSLSWEADNSSASEEPDGSLLCWQEPITGLCPLPD